jgi:hypothetical protein
MRMGLQNLVGISLEQVAPVKETVKRLLDAAARHIADAKVQAISAETRFSSAYTAIRMLADVGLHAHGYRTLTSRPGHHQTAIQTLPTTLGIDSQTLVRLDHLRKQRNLNRTNATSRLGAGTLADALAERDVLKIRHTAYRELAAAASTAQTRTTRSEVKFVSTVSVAAVQRKADDLAKELRELDTRIQEADWQINLLE